MMISSLGVKDRLLSRTRSGAKITQCKLVSPLIGMAVDLFLVLSDESTMELSL